MRRPVSTSPCRLRCGWARRVGPYRLFGRHPYAATILQATVFGRSRVTQIGRDVHVTTGESLMGPSGEQPPELSTPSSTGSRFILRLSLSAGHRSTKSAGTNTSTMETGRGGSGQLRWCRSVRIRGWLRSDASRRPVQARWSFRRSQATLWHRVTKPWTYNRFSRDPGGPGAAG